MNYFHTHSNIFGFPSITSIIMTCVLTVLFKRLLNKLRKDPRLVNFAATLPGPTPLPLIGNGLDFLFNGTNVVKTIIGYSEKYGSMYRLWLGKHLIVGMTNVQDLEVVFGSSKMLGKPDLFKPFQDVWGDGIFTAPMYIWKKTRKLYQPFFVNRSLSLYVNDFNDKIYQYVNKMKDLVDEPPFHLHNYLPYLSFDIISKTALGSELDAHGTSTLKFHVNVENGMDLSYLRMFRPWLHIKAIYNLLLKKKVETARNNMVMYSENVVASKLLELQNSESTYKSYMSIAYKNSMDTNNVTLMHDEIITILTGGTETISVTNSFLLLAVAANTHIQDRLYDEMFEVFGDSDRVANESDIDRLSYLDQVVRETLRRFPIVPVIFRSVDEDLKIGSRIFPAGTELMISILGVHFNPEYFPSPWQFNPENFSPDAVEKRHKLTFLPFSAGPRNCIGMNYAMLEIKLTITALLRMYSFHTTVKLEDVKLRMGFLLKSPDELQMSIKLRDRRPSYMRSKKSNL